MESVNTKLVYNDQHLEQIALSSKYSANIL